MREAGRTGVSGGLLGVAALLAGPALAQSEVSPFCATVYKAAASAVANRAAGQGVDQLRAALPSRASVAQGDSPDVMIARVIHTILDEVYGGEPLDQSAYAVFRTELCVRDEAKLPVPAGLAAVREQVMACAELDGEARIDCAVAAASPDP